MMHRLRPSGLKAIADFYLLIAYFFKMRRLHLSGKQNKKGNKLLFCEGFTIF